MVNWFVCLASPHHSQILFVADQIPCTCNRHICLLSVCRLCFDPWLGATCYCAAECWDEHLACSLGSKAGADDLHSSHTRVVYKFLTNWTYYRVDDAFHGALVLRTLNPVDTGWAYTKYVLRQTEEYFNPRGSHSCWYMMLRILVAGPFSRLTLISLKNRATFECRLFPNTPMLHIVARCCSDHAGPATGYGAS